MRLVRPLAVLAVAGAAASLPACAVETYPPVVGGYGTVYADYVPPDIYAYPHVWYDGGYAYLVGDRWYYPSGGAWVVLRGEPPALYQYRRGYARGGFYGGGYYGRGYRGGYYPAAPNVAPPAYPNVAPPARPNVAPPARYGAPPPRREP